ncbi:MAG: LytR/AlgR family response regulator transcription factor [Candidatus Kapaibacteriota bacterium]|jgi:two-component system LytT family response regulator
MIRLIIADDEPPARMLLREYLSGVQDVQIIGEAENGAEAVATINALKPDAVILDVQMPELTGFDVLERLEIVPHVIFSTAYNEFAVRAFEENAVDYLMKPYSRERFTRAIVKLQERLNTASASLSHLEALSHLLTNFPTAQALSNQAPLSRLMVRSGSRIIPIAADDIVWIEAAEDYALLHTAQGKFTAGTGIGELEKRLDSHVFMRVHRSAIINTHCIKHVETDANGNLTVILTNAAKVKVSRSYTAQIRGLIV